MAGGICVLLLVGAVFSFTHSERRNRKCDFSRGWLQKQKWKRCEVMMCKCFALNKSSDIHLSGDYLHHLFTKENLLKSEGYPKVIPHAASCLSCETSRMSRDHLSPFLLPIFCRSGSTHSWPTWHPLAMEVKGGVNISTTITENSQSQIRCICVCDNTVWTGATDTICVWDSTVKYPENESLGSDWDYISRMK